jgi:hypothetical protein
MSFELTNPDTSLAEIEGLVAEVRELLAGDTA